MIVLKSIPCINGDVVCTGRACGCAITLLEATLARNAELETLIVTKTHLHQLELSAEEQKRFALEQHLANVANTDTIAMALTARLSEIESTQQVLERSHAEELRAEQEKRFSAERALEEAVSGSDQLTVANETISILRGQVAALAHEFSSTIQREQTARHAAEQAHREASMALRAIVPDHDIEDPSTLIPDYPGVLAGLRAALDGEQQQRFILEQHLASLSAPSPERAPQPDLAAIEIEHATALANEQEKRFAAERALGRFLANDLDLESASITISELRQQLADEKRVHALNVQAEQEKRHQLEERAHVALPISTAPEQILALEEELASAKDAQVRLAQLELNKRALLEQELVKRTDSEKALREAKSTIDQLQGTIATLKREHLNAITIEQNARHKAEETAKRK